MKRKIIKNFIIGLVLVIGVSVIRTTSVSAAWKQDSKGWWNSEGNYYSVGWKQIDNTWYHFSLNGYIQTGWLNDNGNWYFLNTNGVMQTGWINTNDSWYFLNSSGVMQTGWLNDNGNWYFLNTNGVMQTGWVNTNDSWYFLNSSGVMYTGWLNDNGNWYYINENGIMHTGFLKLNNKSYYLNESGAMVTGDITLEGIKYSFNADGEKITEINTSTTNPSIGNEIIKDESTSSGGGSTSSSTSSIIKDSDLPSYSDLCGIWEITQYIPNSGIKSDLSGLLINAAIGEKALVATDKISSNGYSAINPIVKESILTDYEFKKIWGVNLSRIGISDNKVKCLTITRRENTNQTVNVIATKDKKVIAIVEGCPFKLSKIN